MKKWIRWKGLIAFVVIILIFILVWYFLLDGLVKRGIETAGTSIAGAKVDLASADVTLSPLGLTLNGLQVADKESPMTNAVEAGRIAFTLDGLNLLRRKIIINEMAAEGIRFGTPRKTSGATAKAPEKKAPAAAEETAFKLPSVEMPDVKKIIKDEQLDSLKQIEAAREEIKNAGATWRKRVDDLPDKAAYDEYRRRIDALRKSKPKGAKDYKKLASEVSSLTKDIEKDIDRVKKAREEFGSVLASAKGRYAEAEKSPFADARRLMDKYGVSSSGLQNMSRALFGGKVNEWVERGFLLYGRLRPVLERSKEKKGGAVVVKPVRARGVDVKFREERPLPDFLISSVRTSVRPHAGEFTGSILNITPDQDVLGSPTTFSFSGDSLTNARSIKLNGMLNHVDPSRPDDRVVISVSDYRIKDMVLSKSDRLPVSLEQGWVDFDIKGYNIKNALTAQIQARMKSVKFSVSGKDAVARSIASALSGVSSFTLTADVTGTLEKYDVKVSSDLDRILKDAVGSVIKDQSAKVEKELLAAISEKTGGALKDLKAGYTDMESVGGKLGGKSSQLNDLLKDAKKAGGGLKLAL